MKKKPCLFYSWKYHIWYLNFFPSGVYKNGSVLKPSLYGALVITFFQPPLNFFSKISFCAILKYFSQTHVLKIKIKLTKKYRNVNKYASGKYKSSWLSTQLLFCSRKGCEIFFDTLRLCVKTNYKQIKLDSDSRSRKLSKIFFDGAK